MKARQWTDEQIVALLREATKGEKPVNALCRENNVSEPTFYTWRKKFGGVSTREVQRLRELEKENSRLKKLLADRDLEIDCLKEINSKNW